MATNYLSNRAKKIAADALAALTTLKLVLTTSSYTPNKDNNFMSSATAAELSTTNYTPAYGGSGRKTLANVVVTQDDTNDLAKFTFDPVVWTALGPASAGPTTAYALLIAEHGGSDATCEILATYDVVVTVNSGNLTLTPNASGALTIT